MTEADLDAAFKDRRVAPEPVPDAYALRLALLVVALTILFLLYIAVIGLAGRIVYWHATEHADMMRLEAGFFQHVLYIIFLLAGLIFMVGFLRPFLPMGKSPETVHLQREQEPILFAFVERLCATMDAPLPNKIAVTCDPNASIGYRIGLLAAFRRRGTLCIGLPLVRVLNIRQLSGVVAHELGHLNQKRGTLVSLMIMSILSWFAYNVIERGRKKRNLDDEIHWIVSAALTIARIGIGVTRFVLAIIFVLGSIVTIPFRRTAELNADRYGARTAGRTTYGEMLKGLERLGRIWEETAKSHILSWRDRRLSDDLSLYVERRYRGPATDPPRKTNDEPNAAVEYADHPPVDDRIRNIAGISDDGAPLPERSATDLFRNLESLGREATFLFYRETIGRAVSRDHIVPVEAFLRDEIAEEESRDARARVFQRISTGRSPFMLSPIDGIEAGNHEALIAIMRNCRQEILEILPAAREADKEYRELLKESLRVDTAINLQKDKIDVAVSMNLGSPKRLKSRAGEIQPKIDEKRKVLDRFNLLLSRRIMAASALITTADFRGRMPNGDGVARDFAESLAMIGTIDERYRHIAEIMGDLDHLLVLQKYVLDILKDDNFDRCARKYAMGLRRKIAALRDKFGEIPYPFPHARGKITVADYAFRKKLPEKDIERLSAGVMETLYMLLSLHARLMGRLALALEKIEEAATLSPIDKPGARRDREEDDPSHEDDIPLYELDEL